MNRHLIFFLCFFLSCALVTVALPEKVTFDKYHLPNEVNFLLKSWNTQYPKFTKLINIGKSSGNRDLLVLRISGQPESSIEPDSRPAIFVSANLEGVHPIGTEGALFLSEKLLTMYGADKKITDLLNERTVYVAPLLNPDVAQNFFGSPRYERQTNEKPVDEDLDDLIDEDGPDDLNKDGLITQMRAKDPEGTWIPDPNEPRLMRRADPKKGERGVYKIFSEGLDNDGDGEYNEDPPGGIELNRNFPHDFEYFTKAAGLWPVSAEESIALMGFLASHPNIAMVLNFSTENTFLNLQQTGRASAVSGKIRVSRRYATFLGLEADKEYDVQELISILKGMNILGGMEINESTIAMMFGGGPAVSIDRQDLTYMEAVQKNFKDKLKKANLDYPEKRAKGVGKGSFVAFCYYQYGVQVFSSDLWQIPEPKKEPSKDALTVDKLKTISSEDFLALGEEKIEAFLRDQGAPPNFNAAALMKMVESGRVTPARMVEMVERMPQRASPEGDEHPDSYILKWSDSILGGKGFVSWIPFKHPKLGDVEIGGFVPYVQTTPPLPEIEKTISFHADFYIDLMQRLPVLQIKETTVKANEDGLFQVTAYFTNTGWFPTSTAQGRRARTSWPIRVQFKTSNGQSVFSGQEVVTIPFIGGSGDTKKVEWTIKAKKGSKITITATSPKLDSVTKTIVLQ